MQTPASAHLHPDKVIQCDQMISNEDNILNGFGITMAALCASLCMMTSCAGSVPVRWDYERSPVQVTENRPSPSPVLGMAVVSAFDGYGAQGARPAAVRAWHQPALPTDNSPISCDIDYGRPLAVRAFVNYFYVPGSLDLRYLSPASAAFRRVRISTSDDKEHWSEAAYLRDLPRDCPQALPVNASQPVRYWRIEVFEMAPGAESLFTYEMETYTGGVPSIDFNDAVASDLPSLFAKRMSKHTPAIAPVGAHLGLNSDSRNLRLDVGDGPHAVHAALEFVLDGRPCAPIQEGTGIWRIAQPAGDTIIRSRKTRMGVLLHLTFVAADANPLRHERASLRLKAPDADLFYMPAYAWNRKPVDVMANSCNVQTRMAVIGVDDTMVCLIPGTDRGTMGFLAGAAANDLILGPEPTPLLLTAVKGDWWDAFRFATNEVYDFREQPQTIPVSEIQQGISRYMLADDIWEPTLGTLKSWPARDPHTALMGFDCFSFYGATYSIPTYWARYVMNGDRVALERCGSIARWMCRSGLRMKEGPLRGAFFNLQRFGLGETPKLEKTGCTQAGAQILTSQSTGSALWTLQFYRKQTGDNDPEIDAAINEAAEWLLRTQNADGGWPYAFDLSGKVIQGAPSSGSIWNIWALWRLGRDTRDPRYLKAAERARVWFTREFVDTHHYHGYWEDVGPGSREGYEAGIAAVAFGEMGDKDLAVKTARDAMQWVFTRQIEPRESSNSAGLVAEQTGWPPASYCNPMMALAAWNAWQITGDPHWKPFATIPKALGWWYEPESGAMTWIVDSTQMAPLAGPRFESWWSDWCVAQTGTLSLRWLIREVNLRTGSVIDEESLKGTLMGQDVTAWSPKSGFRPVLPQHGQANWLGFRSSDSIMLVLMNDGSGGSITCPLDSRDANGATLTPVRVHRLSDGQPMSGKWSGGSIRIKADETLVLEWDMKP